MRSPRFWRCRVLLDYGEQGDLEQVGWELWERGEMVSTGMMPVGPFDKPSEVEAALIAKIGVQLALDLS